MRKIICPLLGLLLLLCCSFASAGEYGTNIADGTVTATGYGVSTAEARNATHARLLARRAALVDAQRQLAEAVAGVSVDSTTTVLNAVVTNDTIQTRVKALIKGAKIVAEKYQPDGTYELTLSVPVFGVSNSLAQMLLPYNANVEAFPAPTTAPNTSAVTGSAAAAPTYSTAAEGCYTGVIIDCRGLNLSTAMSPVILNDQGTKIYGYKNLDYQRVISKGMVAYASETVAPTRAGSNPLRLTAVSVDGYCNPVLSLGDANKMLTENQLTHFLDYCNVVFLR